MLIVHKSLLFLIVLSFFIPLVPATCFTFPGEHYCQDISQEQAAQYCQDNCNLQQYYSVQPCSELPQCAKVFCKDSCKNEFIKDCRAGEVPSGQEKEWCTAGCCVYKQAETFCQYKNTKAQCALEAEKKGVPFYFDTKITDCSCSLAVLEKAGITPPTPAISENKKMFYVILGIMAIILLAVVYLQMKKH